MSKLIPELTKNFNFTLGMPADNWKTVNYWFVKPEKFPVQVQQR
jgi:hypothetical protein